MTSLVPSFEVRIEIFEAQREQNACCERECYGSSAVGFGMIAHRHLVIEVDLLCPFS